MARRVVWLKEAEIQTTAFWSFTWTCLNLHKSHWSLWLQHILNFFLDLINFGNCLQAVYISNPFVATRKTGEKKKKSLLVKRLIPKQKPHVFPLSNPGPHWGKPVLSEAEHVLNSCTVLGEEYISMQIWTTMKFGFRRGFGSIACFFF